MSEPAPAPAPTVPILVRRVALLCTGLLALVFGGFEVIERLAFADADRATLSLLHLLRGIGSSVLVFAVAVFSIIRADLLQFPFGPAARLAAPADEAALASAWLVRLRWIACAGVALVLVAGSQLGLLRAPVLPALALGLVLLAAFNLAMMLRGPRLADPARGVRAQILVDMVVLAALLHLSGGADNPFLLFFVFPVILASLLLPEGAGYAAAGAASALAAGLALLPHVGPSWPSGLPWIRVAPEDPGRALPRLAALVGAVGATLFLVAFFTSSLVGRLRRRNAEVLGLRESLEAQVRLLAAAQAETTAQRARLGAIIECMGDGVIFVDGDGRVALHNTAAERFRDVNRYFGRPVVECHPEQLRPQVVARFGALARGELAGYHRTIKAKGRSFETTYTGVRGAHGEFLGVVLVARDITERRQMEEQVAFHRQMAAVGRLAAGFAHEIGNPLSSLSTRLRLLEEDPSPGFLRESLAVLQTQLARITRIVRGVSLFARPARAEWADLRVEEVVAEVAAVLQPDAAARGVELALDLARDLPPVAGDRDQLHQVFLNLAKNALEAMAGGGRLAIRAAEASEEVRIDFSDSGAGIAPELQGRVFSPFFTTKQGSGSGLGLCISYGLIEAHGGRIGFESEPRKGTTFTVALPARRRTGAVAQALAAAPTSATGE